MRNWYPVVLLIIFCAAGGAFAEQEMTWQQLNDAIDKRPTDANLWLKRGEVLSKSFEDGEAIDNFSKAIKLNPNLIRAYISRGDAYYSFQKTTEAVGDLLKAQALLKAKSDTQSQEYRDMAGSLARCYKLLKQYDKELPLRLEVIKTSKVVPDIVSLAECQIANHQFKEAAASYQRAIKLDPVRVKLYRQYGDFLKSQGDYAGAATTYTQGIERMDPRKGFEITLDYVLFERRAECYDKLGKHDLAMKDRRHSQNFNEKIFDTVPTLDPRSR